MLRRFSASRITSLGGCFFFFPRYLFSLPFRRCVAARLSTSRKEFSFLESVWLRRRIVFFTVSSFCSVLVFLKARMKKIQATRRWSRSHGPDTRVAIRLPSYGSSIYGRTSIIRTGNSALVVCFPVKFTFVCSN